MRFLMLSILSGLAGGERPKLLPKPTSTTLLCVCEQPILWRDCAHAQARLSIGYSQMRYVPKFHGLAQLDSSQRTFTWNHIFLELCFISVGCL